MAPTTSAGLVVILKRKNWVNAWTAVALLPLSCMQPAAVGSNEQNAPQKIQLDQTQSSQEAKARSFVSFLIFCQIISSSPER
jgi:hypothetical protein